MEIKRILLIILLFVVLGILGIFMIKYSSPKTPSISPNVLSLSQPIYSISGMIEKIDNRAIYVTDQTYKLTYKIIAGKNTSVLRSPVTIPYLFLNKDTNNTTIPTRITFEDLQVGDMVFISTKQDLRTIVKNEFEPSIISKTTTSNSIQGVITEIGNGIVRVNSSSKIYRVDIPSTAEISSLTPQPTRYFFSDLKVGTQITAYTEDDVRRTNDITALRVEPIGLTPQATQPTPTAAPVTPTISHLISPIPVTPTVPLGSPSSTLKK